MTDLNWILGTGFAGMRFYDLPNFLICALFVLSAGRILKVPLLCQGVLLAHCALPFFLNGVLFSYNYMPDAFKYWESFNAIRSGELSVSEAWMAGNVSKAAVLFSFMPFPVAISPISLGFYNTFLYSALFFWLYKKQVFTPVSLWFFLLYPSLALYTGMGLRDTFIFVFMVMSIQWVREGRWGLALIPLYFLYAIKFQNFFIVGPILLIYVLFGIRHIGISGSRAVGVAALSLITLIVVAPIALPEVNKFRAAMFVEDGGNVQDVELIGSAAEFVAAGLVSGTYFFAKPFPWETSNALQLIQAIENVVVLLILVQIVRTAWKEMPRKLMFWLLFMGLAFSVYGLVVFNYGTAARYRYPFIVVFVLFVCSDCRVSRLFSQISSRGRSKLMQY